jgi:DNA processing protein
VETIELTPQSEYGPLLAQMKLPPKKLWAQGSPEAFQLLHLLPDYGFAVVGTRLPQARSETQVKIRLRELASTRLIIISGLALGIDTCAHQTALALGLPTIAILGCGLGMTYPQKNQDLRNEILAKNGLIISEYEEFEGAKPSNFIRRNRIIAGLARAVWIVEAGFRSGALNTALWARQNERECFATPCYPGDPILAGNEGLLKREGTKALWTSEDLSQAWLGFHSVSHPPPARDRSHLTLQTPPLDAQTDLKNRIAMVTIQEGGATVQGLFDWAMEQGFQPLEFYEALQKNLASGLISDRNGVLATEI